MKKLLICVQSAQMTFYPELRKAQQQTWDSKYLQNCSTLYYYGGAANTYHLFPEINKDVMEIACNCSDEYEMMHWKFKKCMDYVWDLDWDFMFRTNASTYVRKDKILDFIQTIPTERYYGGVNGGGYVSGTCALMSRDCVDIARKNFSPEPTGSEDAYLGTILLNNGVKIQDGVKRLQFNFAEDKILEADCYRCKSETKNPDGTLDRSYDLKAFNNLYNHFKSR